MALTKVATVLACVFVVVLFSEQLQVQAATGLETSALQKINTARRAKKLKTVSLNGELNSRASKCAAYFSRNKKLGTCPGKNNVAYLSYYTSSTKKSQQQVFNEAFASWTQRGTIKTGLGTSYKRFGVGVSKGSAGSYVVVLMNWSNPTKYK